MPDVRLPDGTLIKNVPEGTTKAQLIDKVGKYQSPGMKLQNFGGLKQARGDKIDTSVPMSGVLDDGNGNIVNVPAPNFQKPRPAKKVLAKAPMPVPQKPGLARTVFDQSMQGATSGFADEVTDPLGAVVATLFQNPKALINPDAMDENLADSLSSARKETQSRLQNQFEQRPVASILSNIGGIGLTGAAGATTKAGAAVGNLIRSGNIAARIGKGAVAGSIAGGAAGYGAGEDGNRSSPAQQGAILGGVVGAAAPAVGAAITKANTKTIVPNADEIRKLAGEKYQLAEKSGGILKSDFTNKFLNDAKGLLLSDDALVNQMKSNKPLADAFDDLAIFENQPLTLKRAQSLDEQLGNMIDAQMELGKPNKIGKKLIDVQSHLRNMIDEAGEDVIEGGKEGFEALKEGRKLWSTSHRLSDIERIIQRAEDMDNPATAIKTGFRNLYNNPNRIRGYSESEKKAIKKAANSGIVSDILRTAGSRLVPIISGSAGGLGGGAAGAAASMASRGAATRVQLNKAGKAAEIVAKRSGLVIEQPRIGFKKQPMITVRPSDKR